MKKLFGFLTLFIILNITTVYLFLFTSFGNGFVSDMIETNVNEKGVVEFKVEEFVLTTSSLKFRAMIDANSMIDISGGLNIFARTVDLTYIVDIKDLSKLEKFTNQKLNGSFKTSGTVKGNQTLTLVRGITDIFESDTKYNVGLKDFEPDAVEFLVKGAKIDKLLHLVNQPIYAKGFIDINGQITDAKIPTLMGQIETKIYEGKVDNPIVNKAFELKLKNALDFKGDIVTTLQPNKAVTKVDFFTSMANVFVKQAVVNLPSGTINSDYQVKVANLAKLYDVTNTKMRGNIVLDGTVSKTQDLIITGTSNILAGKLDFKLKNDDFSSNVNNIEVKQLTHMLYYPDVFDSKANATVTYNLAKSAGVIDANLIDGHFLPNKFSSVLNQFAKFDLTKEVYDSVDLDSTINKEIIKSTVKMKSNLTEITVPKSTLDTKKRTVDAVVQASIKGMSVNAIVSGSLDSPQVKVDTSGLIKGALKNSKEVKKIEEKIKKQLGGSKEGDSLLKGLKNFLN